MALGVLWGCTWMVAQSIVPADIGAAVDALISRQTHRFALDCALVLSLGVITAASGVLRHRCVVGNFLDAAYRTIQLVTDQVSRLGDTMVRLILDEATSLLDPRSARRLERSMAAVLAGRTVVAIAHRLHTGHDADRVIVVEDGQVREMGSHRELVAAGGAYAALWQSWHGSPRPAAIDPVGR